MIGSPNPPMASNVVRRTDTVMSLEEYDEVTGEAMKAAILRKDVVGRIPPITSVSTTEEGLLVSLDHRGAVALPYIVRLYGKPEPEVIAELGNLIYRDPETQAWQTNDEYLSGNVRAKLAGYQNPTFRLLPQTCFRCPLRM
jgi:N12 class adenine-specific DNA methylase